MTGKKGMNISENSMQNLKQGQGYFAKSKEIARKCQKLAIEKRKENIEEEKQIENTAKILSRLLMKQIKNNTTGEVITQKEAMILTLLNKAIVEKDLKAIEMVLKLIGEFDDAEKTNITINQPIQVNKAELKAVVSDIMDLADEG